MTGRRLKLGPIWAYATSVSLSVTSFILQRFDNPPIFFPTLELNLKAQHGYGRKIRKAARVCSR